MPKRLLIAAAAALSISAGQALAASPYAAIYSFGDSLSDAGNLFLLSANPAYGIAHQPLAPYSDGRFSNGNVWVQDLANDLGLGPVTPSLAGGTDFAFGGATTGTTDYHTATGIDLPAQISQFQAQITAPQSNALYTLSIGANDLFALFDAYESGLLLPSDLESALISVANEAASNVETAVAALKSDGAENLVLFDVPNLGLTPAFNGNALLSAVARGAAAYLDQQILTDLAPLEGPDFTLYDLDTYGLLGDVVADPSAYGFTNVTDPCWTGNATDPKSGTLCSPTWAGQNDYLFWDDVHPTARGQAIISEIAYHDLTGGVPEASTWAMMALGFAGLGVLGARKVRSAAAAG